MVGPPSPRLDFVIVGAQRAGSTYLADLLSQNDEIALPALELPYFEAPYFGASGNDAVLERYFDGLPGRIRGIKRPDYLGKPEVAGNIARSAPDATIVVVLRDPVERLLSAIFWYMFCGRLRPQPLDRVLASLRERAEGTTAALPVHPDWNGELLRFGAYAACLEAYDQHFPAERMVTVLSDDLFDQGRREQRLAALWVQLGVGSVVSAGTGVRENAGIYDIDRLRFLSRRVPFTFTWDHEREFIYVRNRHLHRPARSVVNALFHAVDRTRASGTMKRSRMDRPSPEHMGWAYDYYRDDVARLSRRVELPDAWLTRYAVAGGD